MTPQGRPKVVTLWKPVLMLPIVIRPYQKYVVFRVSRWDHYNNRDICLGSCAGIILHSLCWYCCHLMVPTGFRWLQSVSNGAIWSQIMLDISMNLFIIQGIQESFYEFNDNCMSSASFSAFSDKSMQSIIEVWSATGE